MRRLIANRMAKILVPTLLTFLVALFVSPTPVLAQLSGAALTTAEKAAADAGAAAAKAAIQGGATAAEAATAAASAAANSAASAGASAAQVTAMAQAAATAATNAAKTAAAAAGTKMGKATEGVISTGTITAAAVVAASVAGIFITSGGKDRVASPIIEYWDPDTSGLSQGVNAALAEIAGSQTEEENEDFDAFILAIEADDLADVQAAVAVSASDLDAVLSALEEDAVISAAESRAALALYGTGYNKLTAAQKAVYTRLAGIKRPALTAMRNYVRRSFTGKTDEQREAIVRGLDRLVKLLDDQLQALQTTVRKSPSKNAGDALLRAGWTTSTVHHPLGVHTTVYHPPA